MFYNIYQGGGGLGLLRPAGIHRRHQGGPAAAQLVERGKLGGVLAQRPTTLSRTQICYIFSTPRGAQARSGTNVAVLDTNANSLSVRKRSSTSPDFERLSPSGCSSPLHFQDGKSGRLARVHSARTPPSAHGMSRTGSPSPGERLSPPHHAGGEGLRGRRAAQSLLAGPCRPKQKGDEETTRV